MTETHSDIQVVGRSPKKFSRREFLKMAGTAGVALALGWEVTDKTSDIWEPKVVELGIDALGNPAVMESVLGSSASSLETLALRDHRAEGAPKIEINPSCKPMAEIIGEVLDLRRSEGKPITYQRIVGYESLPYYQDKLRIAAYDPANRDRSSIKLVRSQILGYDPITFPLLMYSEDFLPQEAKTARDMGEKNFDDALDLVWNGSGFLDRTIETLGEESRINWDLKRYTLQATNYWQAHQNEISQVVKTYLQDIKQRVETLVAQIDAPVSAGKIFSYCLDRNSGSVNESLVDTTIFLKYMARNNITLQSFHGIAYYPDKVRENEDWFKANIKDEYGKVGNYSNLPHQTYPYHGLLSAKPGVADLEVDKDLHLLNQIGKPYHAWNIVTLLSALPPAMIQMSVAYRQFHTFHTQGPVKTAADFRVALELDKLDSLFMN